MAVAEELVDLVVPAVAASELGVVRDDSIPLIRLTCLTPSWVSLRSRNGAPCPNDNGSPFMS